VTKTIASAAAVTQRMLLADDTANRDGLLQRVDARSKVIGGLAALVAVAFVHEPPVLAAVLVAALLVALATGVPLRRYVGVCAVVPVFTALVALPATLDVVTDGRVIVPLGTWFGHDVGVTDHGVHVATTLVLRAAVSVAIVALLTLTTTWPRSLAALRSLHVPAVFVAVLLMAHRYVFQLLGSIVDLHDARRARNAGGERDARDGRVFVGACAGALFAKTHAMAEEVHDAMVARGFTGDVRTL
jgi:cobalt ECF transporter T component CbiQ